MKTMPLPRRFRRFLRAEEAVSALEYAHSGRDHRGRRSAPQIVTFPKPDYVAAIASHWRTHVTTDHSMSRAARRIRTLSDR